MLSLMEHYSGELLLVGISFLYGQSLYQSQSQTSKNKTDLLFCVSIDTLIVSDTLNSINAIYSNIEHVILYVILSIYFKASSRIGFSRIFGAKAALFNYSKAYFNILRGGSKSQFIPQLSELN